jgi:hypothetical protein
VRSVRIPPSSVSDPGLERCARVPYTVLIADVQVRASGIDGLTRVGSLVGDMDRVTSLLIERTIVRSPVTSSLGDGGRVMEGVFATGTEEMTTVVDSSSRSTVSVAARRIEDLPCQTFAIPVGAPLDGGPVSAGAHTLQLVLPTGSGMQAVNVGVTVGGPVPASVPAGEGPAVPAGLLLFGLAAAAFGLRRLTVGAAA